MQQRVLRCCSGSVVEIALSNAKRHAQADVWQTVFVQLCTAYAATLAVHGPR
jgi:hypothetical protein